MSEETPQNDEAINEEVNVVIETNDSIPSSESGEQVQAESNEQVDEVAVAKQKANDAFNKQYGEKKQLERDLAVANEFRAKTEQAERERMAATVGEIPAMPDAFDDDFDVKVKQRDDAIIANANYQAQNNAYLQQEHNNQQQAVQAAQAKQTELQNGFLGKAQSSGATNEEITGVINTLRQVNLSNDLGDAIMADKDGYFIAKHLAANPQEAHELNSMNPILAGERLSAIREAASALKPKKSNAPAPVDNLQGVTSDFEAKQYKHIGGSEIEVGANWT